jgi:hypothetical protein
MVQYDEKRINVNVISNFDTTPIQFVSPVNFSNIVTFESDGGTSASGSTSLKITFPNFFTNNIKLGRNYEFKVVG